MEGGIERAIEFATEPARLNVDIILTSDRILGAMCTPTTTKRRPSRLSLLKSRLPEIRRSLLNEGRQRW
jgi:hypothetical protein